MDSARYFNGDWNLTFDSFDKGNLAFFKKFYYFPKEAIAVGFGGWGCKKNKDGSKIAKTCTQDYKQRFATVPFDNYDCLVKINDDYTIKARVPWVWALGKRAEIDRNPMVYGDSGGPVFVNDKPGQQPMLDWCQFLIQLEFKRSSITFAQSQPVENGCRFCRL